MTYIIEIKLPGSGTWFKYFTGIESREEAENIKREADGNLKARVRKLKPESPTLQTILEPRLEEDRFAIRKMRSLVEDVVEAILCGMDKVACPECAAIIDKREQDRENESNAYFCANCGLVFYKRK